MTRAKLPIFLAFEIAEAFIRRVFFNQPRVAGPDLRRDQAYVGAALDQVDRRAGLHGACYGAAELDRIGRFGEVHHHVGDLDAVLGVESFVLNQRGDVAGLTGGAGGNVDGLQGLAGLGHAAIVRRRQKTPLISPSNIFIFMTLRPPST